MNRVSVIIPIAPHHEAISAAAVSSCQAQTVAVDIIRVLDTDGKGAGATRNQGIAQAQTEFISFLDADDQFRPDYAERMLGYVHPGKYVYCDDFQGDSLHQTPDCGAWHEGTWHSVSALVRTMDAKNIGGFNEQLPALEDLDFFLRLQASGVCGVRCPHPLLSYTAFGQRSKVFKQHSDHEALRQDIALRWRERATTMCNCGGQIAIQAPDGQQEGYWLVQALYTPMKMAGPVTGQLYERPRGQNGYQMWVDPRDVESARGRTLWKPLITAQEVAAPAVDDVLTIVRGVTGA